jgi:type 1 glutamine amidotransferase
MKRGAVIVLLAVFSLCSFGGSASVRAADGDGFRSLFDGATLAGWDGDPAFWRVEDGAITGETTAERPTKGNTFIIWRLGELDDFELKLEYRIAGGNSGIQYRSWEDEKGWGKWVVGGYQADFEAGERYSGILYGERFRGVLADRGQKTVIGADHKPRAVGSVGDSAEIQARIRKEDWNEYHIVARGHQLSHRINGQVTCEASDEDQEMRRRSGILALQLHAGPPMKVQFRNLRLKRLSLEDKKKVVLVAGKPSHGWGSHEHNAGCLLLAKALRENMPSVLPVVYRSGWPEDPTAFDNADSIVVYCDGGGGHPINRHLEAVDRLMERGVGLACIHYGVEVPKGKEGDRFLDWIGGYFETHKSVNPHWTLEQTVIGEHPIGRGVKPFAIEDEWYFNMRFRDGMKGVTPVLTAVPPESTISRPDGPHSGNPEVRELVKKKTPVHLAWAAERPGGGRGFGFTGGHTHWNWGHDDFRKLVLNAIVWISGAEVPAGGVPSRTPSREDLEANQDEPAPKRKAE